MTVQNQQGLNIFLIKELKIANLFACVLVPEASEVMLPNLLFLQQAHMWPLEKL
jgi:hypothetical protein